MELETIIVSGVGRAQKDKLHTFSLTCRSWPLLNMGFQVGENKGEDQETRKGPRRLRVALSGEVGTAIWKGVMLVRGNTAGVCMGMDQNEICTTTPCGNLLFPKQKVQATFIHVFGFSVLCRYLGVDCLIT